MIYGFAELKLSLFFLSSSWMSVRGGGCSRAAGAGADVAVHRLRLSVALLGQCRQLNLAQGYPWDGFGDNVRTLLGSLWPWPYLGPALHSILQVLACTRLRKTYPKAVMIRL